MVSALSRAWTLALHASQPTGRSLDWYVRTWFSSPLEVHALELGVFAGLVLVLLLLRRHYGVALGLLVFLYVFSLGVPDGALICSAATDNCVSRPVQGKPWYFLLGLFATLFASMFLARRFLPADDPYTTGGDAERERVRSLVGGPSEESQPDDTADD